MIRITSHQVVAVLGLVMALSIFTILHRLGVPNRICWGGAILAVLVVATFWSAVNLGAEDEEDEE